MTTVDRIRLSMRLPPKGRLTRHAADGAELRTISGSGNGRSGPMPAKNTMEPTRRGLGDDGRCGARFSASVRWTPTKEIRSGPDGAR